MRKYRFLTMDEVVAGALTPTKLTNAERRVVDVVRWTDGEIRLHLIYGDDGPAVELKAFMRATPDGPIPASWWQSLTVPVSKLIALSAACVEAEDQARANGMLEGCE